MVVIMDRLYVLAGPKDDTAVQETDGEEVRGAALAVVHNALVNR